MIIPANGSQSSDTNRTISSIGIPITAVNSLGFRDFILYINSHQTPPYLLFLEEYIFNASSRSDF